MKILQFNISPAGTGKFEIQNYAPLMVSLQRTLQGQIKLMNPDVRVEVVGCFNGVDLKTDGSGLRSTGDIIRAYEDARKAAVTQAPSASDASAEVV